jgi:uncharacterized membrane protein YeaQ/YmgE (transglycosylase-associated protein family)
MDAGIVVAVIVSGFFTGALARFAVPGPDPMPIWLTLAIGLTGSIAGAVVARALGGGGYAVSFTSLGVAVALVLAYRRFVQRRALWGREAYRFPERGLGVDTYRERLRKVGLDPEAIGAAHPAAPGPVAQAETQRLRAMLVELHRAGVLDDEELAEKLRVVEARHEPSGSS